MRHTVEGSTMNTTLRIKVLKWLKDSGKWWVKPSLGASHEILKCCYECKY